MYRIKTEQEFIEEFGEGWKNKINCGWHNPKMNYLFGQSITEKEWQLIEKGGSCYKDWHPDKSDNCDWEISKDMVKEVFPGAPLYSTDALYDTDVKSLADCHGYDFEAEIKGEKVKGKISVESPDRIFLCQDKFDGYKTKNRFGHKYSWVVFNYDYKGLTIIPNGQSITNFKLLTKSFKDVKKDSKSKVCRFDSQGEPRGTIITIHSKSVSPARGSRFVGRTATNLYTGTKANSGKVSYNRIQSI